MFLYYLEKQDDNVSREEIAAAGLVYAFETKGDLEKRGVTHGPDGGKGVVVGRSTGRLGFYPSEQSWQRIPGLTGVWIGRYKKDAIKPSDLERPKMLPGHAVELGDGQTWTVPTARAYVEQNGELLAACALPTRSVLGDDGQWQSGKVLDRYAELWAVATRTRDALLGQVSDFGFAEMHRAATLALAANYFVGAVECAILELFNEETVGRILQALIDMPHVEEWLKKKARESPSTGAVG